MADKSAFDPKNILQSTVEHRGILEELNVPPKVIAFIRENTRRIQTGVICVVIAILAWSAYDYYQEGQREASTSLLAKANKEAREEQRKTAIEELLNKYPRTDAALWGKLELGNMAFEEDNLDQAIAIYSEVLEKMSSGNPFAPLVRYGLAQAYESNKDIDNAVKQYQALTEISGFAGQGYQGLGRIYEKQEQSEKAIESYKKALEQQDLSPGEQEMLEEKLARLQ